MSPIDMGKEIEFKFFTDLTKKILKTCKLRLKRKKKKRYYYSKIYKLSFIKWDIIHDAMII